MDLKSALSKFEGDPKREQGGRSPAPNAFAKPSPSMNRSSPANIKVGGHKVDIALSGPKLGASLSSSSGRAPLRPNRPNKSDSNPNSPPNSQVSSSGGKRSKAEEKALEKQREKEKKERWLKKMAELDRKEKEKEQQKEFTVSQPFNTQHKLHVDFDLKWTGGDPLETFRLEKKYGEGAFATVYKGVHRGSGFELAIKVMNENQMDNQEEIEKEIDVLRKVHGTNLVSYYGTTVHKKQLWILMENCELGSLRNIIETLDRPFTEEQIAFVMRETLKGLLVLHGMNIVHRDVKAGNILLDEKGNIRLADFGVSEFLGNHASGRESMFMKLKETMGTPLWMAPEVILGKKYDTKADLWSLGITVIELGDGLPPNADMNVTRAMKMVPVRPSPKMAHPKHWSKNMNGFLAACLEKDPEKRPSAMDLMMHPFVTSAGSSQVLEKSIAAVREKDKGGKKEKGKRRKEKEKEKGQKGKGKEEKKKSVEACDMDTSKRFSTQDLLSMPVEMSTSNAGEDDVFGTMVVRDTEDTSAITSRGVSEDGDEDSAAEAQLRMAARALFGGASSSRKDSFGDSDYDQSRGSFRSNSSNDVFGTMIAKDVNEEREISVDEKNAQYEKRIAILEAKVEHLETIVSSLLGERRKKKGKS